MGSREQVPGYFFGWSYASLSQISPGASTVDLYDRFQLVFNICIVVVFGVPQALLAIFQRIPPAGPKMRVLCRSRRRAKGYRLHGYSINLEASCRLSPLMVLAPVSMQTLSHIRAQVSRHWSWSRRPPADLTRRVLRLQNMHLRPTRSCLNICFCLLHFTNPDYRFTD